MHLPCPPPPPPPPAEHFLAFLQRFLAFLRQRLAVNQVVSDTPTSFLAALQEVGQWEGEEGTREAEPEAGCRQQ